MMSDFVTVTVTVTISDFGYSLCFKLGYLADFFVIPANTLCSMALALVLKNLSLIFDLNFN